MRFKRLLALLLAAALALSLLVGCGSGKNQSLSQMLLNLLDGQYQNVSVEIDSDLETKLRQAISQSETDEELRAALEQLLGGGISFQRLGSGQQGDTAWTLIIYPGTDPDAAARSVYLDLDKVFAALPDDGVYSSGFAMVEMENGYAILVKATVDKAGTEDKPDPVTLKSIAVTTQPRTTYWVGESFNPANMVITATYSNNTTKDIDTALCSLTIDGADATEYKFGSAGSYTVTISYGGQTTTVPVKVKEPEVDELKVEPSSLTYTAGDYFNYGAGKNITVTAGYTYGEDKVINIKDCNLTLTSLDGGSPETVDDDYRFMTAGSYTLTVSFGSKDAQVNIEVNPATVTGIDVTWPNKTYYEEDTLRKPDVTVEAKYSNDVQSRVSDFLLTIKGPGDDATTKEITDEKPYKFDTAGEYTLTVTYTDNGVIKTDDTTIEVEDKGYKIEGNTYKVSNTHGLQAWNEAVQKDLTLNCTLTADIDMAGQEWTPIGSYDEVDRYTGTFDGGRYTIKNLTINQYGNYVGMIDFLGEGGTVKNVTLENVNITGGDIVGSVVGDNYGTVIACTASGNVSGTSRIGGVVGYNNGTVTACYHANGTVSGDSYVGGVVGRNTSGTVTACYHASGNVSGTSNVGGVMGYNISGAVTACYWSGLPDNDNGGATKVDGQSVTWQKAVDAMNTALSGDGWQYELIGALPTLKKTNP